MATTFARCAFGLTFKATWNRETAQRRTLSTSFSSGYPGKRLPASRLARGKDLANITSMKIRCLTKALLPFTVTAHMRQRKPRYAKPHSADVTPSQHKWIKKTRIELQSLNRIPCEEKEKKAHKGCILAEASFNEPYLICSYFFCYRAYSTKKDSHMDMFLKDFSKKLPRIRRFCFSVIIIFTSLGLFYIIFLILGSLDFFQA